MAVPSMLLKESEELEADLRDHFSGKSNDAPIEEPVQMVEQPVVETPLVVPIQEAVQPVQPEPEHRHVDGLGEFAGPQQTEPNWEQKFKSLDGRIRKENESSVGYQNENSALKLELEQLKRTVEENQSRNDAGHYLTSEQKEEFDDEQIAMAASVAKGVVNPAFAELQGEVKALRDILAESQADHATQLKETFTRELLRLVPDWYELNDARNMATLGFREWLHEIDPSTGYVRLDILNHLCRGRESERVATWVNQYKQSHGIAVSPVKVVPIENLVEPKGSTGSAVSSEPGKTTYTVKNAKIRYDEIAKRLTSGRVSGEERLKLQKELDDLDRAFAEGRVFEEKKSFV